MDRELEDIKNYVGMRCVMNQLSNAGNVAFGAILYGLKK